MNLFKLRTAKIEKNKPLLLRISFVAMFSFAAISIFAQTGTIKGVVADSKTYELLIGATVMIEGTTNGASVDSESNAVREFKKGQNISLGISYEL